MANVKFNSVIGLVNNNEVVPGMLFRGKGSDSDCLYLVVRVFGDVRLVDVTDGTMLSGDDMESDDISEVEREYGVTYLPNATIVVE